MFPQLYLRFPGGKSRALTLSYDDGVEQDERLLSIMNAHGLKGTFNLNSDLFSPEGVVFPAGHVQRRMTLSAAQKLYAGSGNEIGFHGGTHAYMEELPPNRQGWEIMGDREKLENAFGGLVRGGAYPFGAYSDALIDVMQACGVAYCRTTVSTHGFQLPQEWLKLNPTCRHADPEMMSLTRRFLDDPIQRGPYLFYI